MPIYDYRCQSPVCRAEQELIRAHDITSVPCKACGGEATRKSVYSFAHTHPRFWGSDFEFTPAMRAAHDEALGYKHEAQAALAEEQANGFARKEAT